MDWTRRAWVGAGLFGLGGLAACGTDSAEPATQSSAVEPTPDRDVLGRSIVLDLHCDTPMVMRAEGYDLGIEHDYAQVDIPRMRRGGLSGVFFSVYCSASRNSELQAVTEALEIIDLVRTETARFPEDLTLATTTGEIAQAKRNGKIAVLMGVEGGHMLNSSLGVLRNFHRLGVRYLTLTHSKDTSWAGSSGEKGNKGLNEFGREVVSEMNQLGMMVDLSHVSDKTFADVIETTKAPPIASHSSARALANHARNMTDDMIRALADKGGVIHINYFNQFLDRDYAARSAEWGKGKPSEDDVVRQNAGNPGAQERAVRERTAAKLAVIGRTPLSILLDHFEHAVKVGGIEAVGMGSDFDGVSDELPEGMEDISKIPNLVAGLSERGFSDDHIEKILGGNTLRVMRDVEAAAG